MHHRWRCRSACGPTLPHGEERGEAARLEPSGTRIAQIELTYPGIGFSVTFGQ